ncbi:MAG: hypothetical protein C5B49_11535 [Bdellovibrio sp.]|nr:MAG: hypothetical protein C5B49_11535 [Bdellovibrio sp.]
MGGLFIFVTLGFFAVALFFPELVGITGKVARNIEESHRGDDPAKQPNPNESAPAGKTGSKTPSN